MTKNLSANHTRKIVEADNNNNSFPWNRRCSDPLGTDQNENRLYTPFPNIPLKKRSMSITDECLKNMKLDSLVWDLLYVQRCDSESG